MTSTKLKLMILLYSISSNDSGHYMCAVFNGGRRYVRRTTVSVVVPPQHVIKDEVYLHVREGDSIELPSQASGSPPPFILWRFNGQPVSGLASATVNRITGKLVILNAMPGNLQFHTLDGILAKLIFSYCRRPHWILPMLCAKQGRRSRSSSLCSSGRRHSPR